MWARKCQECGTFSKQASQAAECLRAMLTPDARSANPLLLIMAATAMRKVQMEG